MAKVLITGMSGLIGGVLRKHLESRGGYELVALNRSHVQGVPCFRADIADLEAIKPAFGGVDVVVHLASQVQDDPWEGLLRTNIIGTYNVYEAARLARVRRVVFASSGSTITGYEQVPPYDAIAAGRYDEVPLDYRRLTYEAIWPTGTYGVSKVWGEALGRHFSDAHGLSVRIGRVTPDNMPWEPRDRSVYLSHDGVAEILTLCIEAPENLKYDVFLATSANRWSYRDLEHAREALGFVPVDSADDV